MTTSCLSAFVVLSYNLWWNGVLSLSCPLALLGLPTFGENVYDLLNKSSLEYCFLGVSSLSNAVDLSRSTVSGSILHIDAFVSGVCDQFY